MEFILLTQHGGTILGPIAKVLGLLLNFIYNLGIHNLGVCIILFTLIVYFIMLPITLNQQKTARIQQFIAPELQKINKKYEGKKDQQSQLQKNEEIRALNAKYGISTAGGCINTLITFPVLIAFYNVIRNIPAYIISLKNLYLTKGGIVDAIVSASSSEQKAFINIAKKTPVNVTIDAIKNTGASKNKIIDALWKFNDETYSNLADKMPQITSQITEITIQIKKYTTFLCYNIIESPMAMLKNAWNDKEILLCIAALLIPVVSALTQWLSIKLMPTVASGAGEGTESTLKTMNAIMPLFSLVFCFSVPIGVGLYWIVSAVFRAGQQFCINKYLDKKGIENIVAKSSEKAKIREEKRKNKKGESSRASLLERASTSTRNINYEQKEGESNYNIRSGSIRDKANLVQKYNEKNKEKE